MATSSTRSAICKAQQFNYALNLTHPKNESHQQYSATYADRDLLNRTPFSAHSTLLPIEESRLSLFTYTKPIIQENPIHRPVAATVNQTAMDASATSFSVQGLRSACGAEHSNGRFTRNTNKTPTSSESIFAQKNWL